MSLSRKSFLQTLGLGAVGLGASRLWAAREAAVLPSLPDFSAPHGEAFWAAVRGAYRVDPQLHYFNTGGLGPSVDGVRAVVDAMAASLEFQVESGHAQLDEPRSQVAEFLGCGADEVALVRNATEGNGIIAAGLELEAGDEVAVAVEVGQWIAAERRIGDGSVVEGQLVVEGDDGVLGDRCVGHAADSRAEVDCRHPCGQKVAH